MAVFRQENLGFVFQDFNLLHADAGREYRISADDLRRG